jgi:lipid A 4'-phosphatase
MISFKSLSANPWFWAVLVLVPVTFIPTIDLTVSSWFFDPAAKLFPARSNIWAEWIRKDWPYLMFGMVSLVPILYLWGAAFKRPVLGITKMPALFLILSLVLGPGLVVNFTLKDHWGRPRPSTVTQFGGPFDYRMPLLPGGPCVKNCSFPSGHASLAYWLVAPALLAPVRRRKVTVSSAVFAGLVVGAVRVAQGGHFLSDILYAGIFTVGITYILYRFMIAPSSPRVTEQSDS